jgi:hypothetical protein
MVATPFLKRRQQALKPRDIHNAEAFAVAFAVEEAGAVSTKPSIGGGSLVRPGSWTEAKAQDLNTTCDGWPAMQD